PAGRPPARRHVGRARDRYPYDRRSRHAGRRLRERREPLNQQRSTREASMSIAETYENRALAPQQLIRGSDLTAAPANQNAANQNTEVSFKTWMAVTGATLGAFLAVLNIQVVNSSLADIQGAIGAGIDDGGWISTSYLIAEIIVIPLSGWMARVFSMRNYLL